MGRGYVRYAPLTMRIPKADLRGAAGARPRGRAERVLRADRRPRRRGDDAVPGAPTPRPAPCATASPTRRCSTSARRSRRRGRTWSAIYHSHTGSPAYPSQTDINLAFWEWSKDGGDGAGAGLAGHDLPDRLAGRGGGAAARLRHHRGRRGGRGRARDRVSGGAAEPRRRRAAHLPPLRAQPRGRRALLPRVRDAAGLRRHPRAGADHRRAREGAQGAPPVRARRAGSRHRRPQPVRLRADPGDPAGPGHPLDPAPHAGLRRAGLPRRRAPRRAGARVRLRGGAAAAQRRRAAHRRGRSRAQCRESDPRRGLRSGSRSPSRSRSRSSGSSTRSPPEVLEAELRRRAEVEVGGGSELGIGRVAQPAAAPDPRLALERVLEVRVEVDPLVGLQLEVVEVDGLLARQAQRRGLLLADQGRRARPAARAARRCRAAGRRRARMPCG